jgi:hypothetical protein
LLNEPDLSKINGIFLNIKFKELKEDYQKMMACGGVEEDANMKRDFNELVEQLGEENLRID